MFNRYRLERYDYILKEWYSPLTYNFFFLSSAKKEVYGYWKRFNGSRYWWKYKWRISRIKDNRVLCEISIKERKW